MAFQTDAPRRITNKISRIANSQQFGLFLSSKLSTFCQRSCIDNNGSRIRGFRVTGFSRWVAWVNQEYSIIIVFMALVAQMDNTHVEIE